MPFIYVEFFEQNPKVELHPRKLIFSAPGHGAKGHHNYGFSLHFSGELNPVVSTMFRH